MAEQSKFWYLEHFNLFEGMDDAAMDALNRMASMSTVEHDQPIFFPNDPSLNLFLLKHGHVKLSRMNDAGKEIILDIIGPGEIFGELSVVEAGAQRNEFAQALDDVIICTIRREDFEELLKKNPELNFKVTKRMGLRLKKFEERVTDLVFKDARQRITGFLFSYATEFGKSRAGVLIAGMTLSHQDIGHLTGTARQTVTTTLNELRESGIIEFNRQSFSVLDLARLKTGAGIKR